MVWERFFRNRFAMVGLVLLTILVFAAIFAPWITRFNPNAMDMRNPTLAPGTNGHLLGTDDLGRDVLARLIFGSRVSLTVGIIVVGIAGSIGIILGAISGFYGGWLDEVIMRIADILQAFPFLVLALAVVAIVGPSLTNMMIVLGLVSWIEYARLVRAQVLLEKEKEYVVAAVSLGEYNSGIIFKHILPNCLSPILVQATFGVAVSILAASALSYLGMGVQPPTPEWGAMLSSAKPLLREHPTLSVFPGLAIMLTVLSINFIGDGLRDAFDPRIIR